MIILYQSLAFSYSEFCNGICIDAYDILLNLCQWVQTYFYEDNMIILQSSKIFFFE